MPIGLPDHADAKNQVFARRTEIQRIGSTENDDHNSGRDPISRAACLSGNRVGKTHELSMHVARPLDGVFPLESAAGIAFANILAILLILAFCFLAGLAARSGLFASRVEKLDGFLLDVMPA